MRITRNPLNGWTIPQELASFCHTTVCLYVPWNATIECHFRNWSNVYKCGVMWYKMMFNSVVKRNVKWLLHTHIHRYTCMCRYTSYVLCYKSLCVSERFNLACAIDLTCMHIFHIIHIHIMKSHPVVHMMLALCAYTQSLIWNGNAQMKEKRKKEKNI